MFGAVRNRWSWSVFLLCSLGFCERIASFGVVSVTHTVVLSRKQACRSLRRNSAIRISGFSTVSFSKHSLGFIPSYVPFTSVCAEEALELRR